MSPTFIPRHGLCVPNSRSWAMIVQCERYPVSGVRCQVSGVRCPVSGVRCLFHRGSQCGFSVKLSGGTFYVRRVTVYFQCVKVVGSLSFSLSLFSPLVSRLSFAHLNHKIVHAVVPVTHNQPPIHNAVIRTLAQRPGPPFRTGDGWAVDIKLVRLGVKRNRRLQRSHLRT